MTDKERAFELLRKGHELDNENKAIIIDALGGMQKRTGHWIEKEDFNGDTYYDCSECGESFCLMDGTPTDNLYNFCPNCGADMRGDTE